MVSKNKDWSLVILSRLWMVCGYGVNLVLRSMKRNGMKKIENILKRMRVVIIVNTVMNVWREQKNGKESELDTGKNLIKRTKKKENATPEKSIGRFDLRLLKVMVGGVVYAANR